MRSRGSMCKNKQKERKNRKERKAKRRMPLFGPLCVCVCGPPPPRLLLLPLPRLISIKPTTQFISRSRSHMHRLLLEGPVACPLAHARPSVQHAAAAAARIALVTFGLDDARRACRNSGT